MPKKTDKALDKSYLKALSATKKNRRGVHGVKTRTINIYSFEELTPKAQERAIDHFRETEYEDPYMSERISESFQEFLKEKGLPHKDVRWRLSSSQGDGVAFYGKLDLDEYVKKNKLVTKYQPIIDLLPDMVTEIESISSHYDHWNTMRVNIQLYGDVTEKQEKLFEKLEKHIAEDIQDVSRKLEKDGYEEIEYLTSDETIKENILANDYEFYESGKVA